MRQAIRSRENDPARTPDGIQLRSFSLQATDFGQSRALDVRDDRGHAGASAALEVPGAAAPSVGITEVRGSPQTGYEVRPFNPVGPVLRGNDREDGLHIPEQVTAR